MKKGSKIRPVQVSAAERVCVRGRETTPVQTNAYPVIHGDVMQSTASDACGAYHDASRLIAIGYYATLPIGAGRSKRCTLSVCPVHTDLHEIGKPFIDKLDIDTQETQLSLKTSTILNKRRAVSLRTTTRI